MLSLLTLRIRCKRDALVARQRARQIAALFHFSTHDQALIAAGAFAIAAQAYRRSRSGCLRFAVSNDSLDVFVEAPASAGAPGGSLNERPGTSLRLVKALPAPAEFADDDLVWLVKQWHQESRSGVFEEIERQNQEMLTVLHALHVAGAAPQSQRAVCASSAA